MKIGKYWKTVVSAVAAGAVIANEALSDDALTSTEGITIALAVLGAVGVWAVPNQPAGERPVPGYGPGKRR